MSKCKTCRGSEQVEDYASFNRDPGERKMMPCPDCPPSTEQEIVAIEVWIAAGREYHHVNVSTLFLPEALDVLEGLLERLAAGYRSSVLVAAQVGMSELVDAPAEAIHAIAIALDVAQ